MTHKERLDFCNQCMNRGFDPKFGIICSITLKQPDFENFCAEYKEDTAAKEMKILNKAVFVDDQKKSINHGRITLFAIAAIQMLVSYFYVAFKGSSINLVLPDIIVAILFIGFGILSFKKPYLALLLGLFTYLTIILIVALINPITIFGGILLKIFIITTLIYSTSVAKSEEKRLKAIAKN